MTASRRVVNWDIVMEIRRRPSIPDRSVTHAARLGGIGVLIMDVRTREQWYVPVEASDNHKALGDPECRLRDNDADREIARLERQALVRTTRHHRELVREEVEGWDGLML